jgi:hypothetical protein
VPEITAVSKPKRKPVAAPVMAALRSVGENECPICSKEEILSIVSFTAILSNSELAESIQSIPKPAHKPL